MNLLMRVTLVVGCLAACIAGQRQLDARLRAASLETTAEPAPPLELLPHALGRWHGEDETIRDADRSPSADLQRLFFHADTGQAVRVTLRHLPAGGGAPPAPLVAGPAERVTFYWYYALPTAEAPQVDLFAQAYRRLHLRPAYVAVDVAVPESDATDSVAAVELVQFVDAAVRQLLGPAAGRYGSFDTPMIASRS